MNEVQKTSIPAVAFLKMDDQGNPRLCGSRCQQCGAVMPGERVACARCGARDPETVRLGEKGKIFTYTIVHRSFPGVKTPFAAVVVDLDGGGTIAGTLVDITPELSSVSYDMPVRVVYRDSGQRNAEGLPFIAYYFSPLNGEG